MDSPIIHKKQNAQHICRRLVKFPYRRLPNTSRRLHPTARSETDLNQVIGTIKIYSLQSRY